MLLCMVSVIFETSRLGAPDGLVPTEAKVRRLENFTQKPLAPVGQAELGARDLWLQADKPTGVPRWARPNGGQGSSARTNTNRKLQTPPALCRSGETG